MTVTGMSSSGWDSPDATARCEIAALAPGSPLIGYGSALILLLLLGGGALLVLSRGNLLRSARRVE